MTYKEGMTKSSLNLIGLCGWPGAGKDEVANILKFNAGFVPIDDGLCLRLAVPPLFGCEGSLPFSREGKDTVVETVDGPKTVRDLLGTVGQLLEDEYGENFMPFSAVREAKKLAERRGNSNFVFPSVRKTQGWYYKGQGGKVIEVRRPGIPESNHDFDRWDKTAVDAIIVNDGDLEDLKRSVIVTMLNIDKYPDHLISVGAGGILTLHRSYPE